MDNLIKLLLKEISFCVDDKDKCSYVLYTIMDDFIYCGIIDSYDIHENGKWAFEISWINKEGKKCYTFCVNSDWFPVQEFMQ